MMSADNDNNNDGKYLKTQEVRKYNIKKSQTSSFLSINIDTANKINSEQFSGILFVILSLCLIG